MIFKTSCLKWMVFSFYSSTGHPRYAQAVENTTPTEVLKTSITGMMATSSVTIHVKLVLQTGLGYGLLVNSCDFNLGEKGGLDNKHRNSQKPRVHDQHHSRRRTVLWEAMLSFLHSDGFWDNHLCENFFPRVLPGEYRRLFIWKDNRIKPCFLTR